MCDSSGNMVGAPNCTRINNLIFTYGSKYILLEVLIISRVIDECLYIVITLDCDYFNTNVIVEER